MAKGTTMDVLNLTIIQEIPFPLCSLLEQEEIIKELQSKFSILEALEDGIKESIKKVQALRQSILQKAFSGKLVKQDPSDEPASIFLQRIKEARKIPKSNHIKLKR